MDKAKETQNVAENTTSAVGTQNEEKVQSNGTVETPTNEKETASQSTENSETQETEDKESKEEKKEEEAKVAEAKEEEKEDEHPLVLKNLDLGLTYDVLSVPTYSRSEYRMVTFILLWARANKIAYEFDTYGNIYLTKGELDEGEFYPCVTSHLDTVQKPQEAYAQCGVPLQLLERVNAKGGHELYVADCGIGADDKAGILISLNLFKYFDKLKACFFLEEEIGCCGSKKLNKEWFTNVGYVIGWDSPERDRAAYACSGELLMSKDFFENIKDVCKENGVTNFHSEPFTDVKEIRAQTNVMCMNFGNGGYHAHAMTEYVVLEDIDGALGLGIALIKHLGLAEYKMKSTELGYGYNSNMTDENVAYFKKMDQSTYAYYGTATRTTATTTKTTQTTNSGTTNTTSTAAKDKEEDDTKIPYKTFEHALERYDKHIASIQEKCETRDDNILEAIKKLFDEKKEAITFDDIKNVITAEYPSAEPFSTAIEF